MTSRDPEGQGGVSVV